MNPFTGYRTLLDDLVVSFESYADAVDTGPIFDEDHTFWRVIIKRDSAYIELDLKELNWVHDYIQQTQIKKGEVKLSGFYESKERYGAFVLILYFAYGGLYLCFQRLDLQQTHTDFVTPSLHIFIDQFYSIYNTIGAFPKHPRD